MKLALACLFLAGSFAAPAKADDQPATVTDLLKSIQRALDEAAPTIKTLGVPALDSVTLVVQAEGTKSGTGAINLWFVKIGGSAEKDASTQMTFVLTPASAPTKNVAGPPLDETIKDALISAAQGVYDAQKPPSPVALSLKSLKAEFAFTVKKSGNAGVAFQLVPIGGSIGATGTTTGVQKITVQFGKPSDAKGTS